jgi:hypothetical protein
MKLIVELKSVYALQPITSPGQSRIKLCHQLLALLTKFNVRALTGPLRVSLRVSSAALYVGKRVTRSFNGACCSAAVVEA